MAWAAFQVLANRCIEWEKVEGKARPSEPHFRRLSPVYGRLTSNEVPGFGFLSSRSSVFPHLETLDQISNCCRAQTCFC